MADSSNNEGSNEVASLRRSKMAYDNRNSANLESENVYLEPSNNVLLEAMRDIASNMASKENIRDTTKMITDLIDNMRKQMELLFNNVATLEAEVEHFPGQLKDFEAMSVFTFREFIDNHIANIVKPIEESLISRISKIEDQYNLGSDVQGGLSTPVVHGK